MGKELGDMIGWDLARHFSRLSDTYMKDCMHVPEYHGDSGRTRTTFVWWRYYVFVWRPEAMSTVLENAFGAGI